MFKRIPAITVLTLLFALQLSAQTPKATSATIAGVVTLRGQPMRGVTITVQSQNPMEANLPLPRAQSDADGRFRIPGIAAGQYIISALAPALVTEGEQANSFSIQNSGQSNRFPGVKISLAEGETIENLELKLMRGGVITGQITDSHNDPVTETNVQLRRLNDRDIYVPFSLPMNSKMALTDDRGVYRIFGLPAGKYKVSVGVPVREGAFALVTTRSYFPETFYPSVAEEAQAKIIELEEGQEVTDVSIQAADAKRAYELSGHVLEADTGKPVVGVNVAFGAFNQTGRLVGSAFTRSRTEANGAFQILGARPGKLAVYIENTISPSEFYSELTPVEVVDNDVSGIEVRAQRGVSISGTVIIEGTKDPAVLAKRSQMTLGISSDVTPPNLVAGSRSTRVGVDGSFRFSGLPPGKSRFNGFPILPKLSLLRVEQNGAPLKNLAIETRSGEQINNLRIVFGYGDGTLRGQVKVVGGILPENFKLLVRVTRTGALAAGPPLSPDANGQFLLRDLVPGEYEIRVYSNITGQIPQELARVIFPILANIKQFVTVRNGEQAQTTITIDLSK